MLDAARGQARAAASPGWRCWPARRPTTRPGTGSRPTPSPPSTSISSASRASLTTPVGGGFRSLNVAIRQIMDLYVCLRPVRWFQGVPSPVLGAAPGRHGDLPGDTPRTSTPVWRCRRARPMRPGSSSSCTTPSAGRSGPTPGVGIKPVSKFGVPAPAAGRPQLRRAPGPQAGPLGAQGQHHEVHRGRLPGLGLRAGARGVRGRGGGLGGLRRRRRRQDPGTGHHRRHRPGSKSSHAPPSST